MQAQIEIINIKWEGPLTLKQAYGKNGEIDYGVYQCYGDHPVYGLDVLLEIGKASRQKFGKKLRAYDFENWDQYWNQNFQIYLGRICIEKEPVRPSDKVLRNMIDHAGKLLIYACCPAFNTSGINTLPDADRHKELLILNWGKYRSLLPAVSGYRVIEQS